MNEKTPFLTLNSTIIIFLCGLSVYIGQLCFWSDSEMWAVTSNYHMFSKIGVEHNHWVKPLFGLYIFLITKLGSFFNINIMSSARFIFAIQSVVSVYLFYRLSFRVSKHKLLASLAALTLVATSLYWERAFRVRSDLLVLLIYLIIFNLLYSEKWNNKYRWISFVLIFISLLVTPKSIVLAAILFIVYFKLLLPKKLLSKKYLYIMCGAAITGVAIFAMSNSTAVNYFVESFRPTGKGYSYFSAHRFEHIIRFGLKNIWILTLLVFPILSLIKYKKPFLDRRYFTFSMLALLLLVFYPNRLPFFIYSLLPFIILGLFANPILGFLLTSTNMIKAVGLFVVVIGLLYSGVKNANFVYEKHNNIEQKDFQAKLCGYLDKFPQAKVLDPIGVCPERLNSYYFYLGPFHDNSRHLENIKILKPDIVLNIAKLQFLTPHLDDFFKANYFYSKTGIFYKFLVVNNPKGEMSKSQLSHRIKARLGEPNKEFKMIYKKFVGLKNKGKIITDIKDIDLSKQKPVSNASILTGYELVLVSPFNIDKLDLPQNTNALFRHDVEI